MPDSEPAGGTAGRAEPSSGPPPGASGKWGDLGTRIISATVMLAVTVAALWLGGIAWGLLVAVVAALMGWELARLCDPALDRRLHVVIGLGLILPVAIMAWALLAPDPEAAFIRRVQMVSWAAMAVVLLHGLAYLRDGRWIWLGYGLMLQLGAQYFLFTGLDPWGLAWLLSVVAIVMISDILGYFAGRLIGGPKFWPRISPKKTWSGTVAGWIGAAVFGALVIPRFVTGPNGPNPLGMAVVAVMVALAGQMGDIAASAIKRRVGVKDASALIPGHGGFMDRLDAMIAAGAATLVWMLVF